MSDFKLRDGTGKGFQAKVDSDNRLATFSVIETEQLTEAQLGNAYNLNTGTLALTSASESAVMYMKNNEDKDFFLTALAAGIGILSSPTDSTVITMIRNPTGGTIVDDASAVAQNENRNFGSNKTLAADVYKGAEGKTLTGGTTIAQFFAGSGSRLFAGIDFVIPRGSSVGIKIDLNAAAGGNIYIALIGYLH